MEFSRSQECNTNAALNYGYSIILSVFSREVVANGYSTQIGVFHDNMYNQYNLACDLMEPFRPFIDAEVIHMNLEAFEHEQKMQLVQLLNRSVLLDGCVQYMLNAIRQYVKSVFEAINENDISKIKFPCYELQIYEDDGVL